MTHTHTVKTEEPHTDIYFTGHHVRTAAMCVRHRGYGERRAMLLSCIVRQGLYRGSMWGVAVLARDMRSAIDWASALGAALI